VPYDQFHRRIPRCRGLKASGKQLCTYCTFLSSTLPFILTSISTSLSHIVLPSVVCSLSDRFIHTILSKSPFFLKACNDATSRDLLISIHSPPSYKPFRSYSRRTEDANERRIYDGFNFLCADVTTQAHLGDYGSRRMWEDVGRRVLTSELLIPLPRRGHRKPNRPSSLACATQHNSASSTPRKTSRKWPTATP